MNTASPTPRTAALRAAIAPIVEAYLQDLDLTDDHAAGICMCGQARAAEYAESLLAASDSTFIVSRSHDLKTMLSAARRYVAFHPLMVQFPDGGPVVLVRAVDARTMQPFYPNPEATGARPVEGRVAVTLLQPASYDEATLAADAPPLPHDWQGPVVDAQKEIDRLIAEEYGRVAAWRVERGLPPVPAFDLDHELVAIARDVIKAVGESDWDGDSTLPDLAAAATAALATLAPTEAA